MLPTQQQQPPIKAQTAPGASGPPGSATASTGKRIHKDNLAALGGGVAMGLAVFWLVIAILSSILQVAGLAALQSYSYRFGIPFERYTGSPRLSPGNWLRREWWFWVFDVIALCAMPCLALASGSVARARGALLAWATVATTLSILAADRLYNVSSNTEGMYYSSARTAFTGFLLAAASGLALSYHFGVRPAAREHE